MPSKTRSSPPGSFSLAASNVGRQLGALAQAMGAGPDSSSRLPSLRLFQDAGDMAHRRVVEPVAYSSRRCERAPPDEATRGRSRGVYDGWRHTSDFASASRTATLYGQSRTLAHGANLSPCGAVVCALWPRMVQLVDDSPRSSHPLGMGSCSHLWHRCRIPSVRLDRNSSRRAARGIACLVRRVEGASARAMVAG
jgi:hypothetical protein